MVEKKVKIVYYCFVHTRFKASPKCYRLWAMKIKNYCFMVIIAFQLSYTAIAHSAYQLVCSEYTL